MRTSSFPETKRRIAIAFVAGCVFFGVVGFALAQFRLAPYLPAYAVSRRPHVHWGPVPQPAIAPVYPYASAPVVGPYAPPANTLNGYLSGGVSANSAQGGLLIDQEQANLMKQQVKAAEIANQHQSVENTLHESRDSTLMQAQSKSIQLATRRQTYEEYLYEKSVTDRLNDEQAAMQQEQLREAIASSPLTDVWSGKALNAVVAHIQTLHKQGIDGPDLPLSAQTLAQLNVTSQAVACRLLTKPGKLTWPLGLLALNPQDQSRAVRDQIDTLLSDCKKQGLGAGPIDLAKVAQLSAAVTKLRGMLTAQMNEFSFTDFSKAKDFLAQLDQAVQVLQQPDAGNYLNGKYQARGATVSQLAQYMTESRLKFAPSSVGEEGAYSALYQSLVQYDLAASSQASQQQSPPLLPQPKLPG